MEAVVGAAVLGAYPKLSDEALAAVSLLMCAEAALRARSEPFDPDAAVLDAVTQQRDRTLAFLDDKEEERLWTVNDKLTAVEAFWGFVAERIGFRNEMFTIEDDSLGGGLILYFDTTSMARIGPASKEEIEAGRKYHVEYALTDDFAHYRAVVREYLGNGFEALDGLASWTSDQIEFEEARQRRDNPEPNASELTRYVFRDDADRERKVSVAYPQQGYAAFSSFFKGSEAKVFTIEDVDTGQTVVLMPKLGVISRSDGRTESAAEYLKVDHVNAYMPVAMLFFENGYSGLNYYGQWLVGLESLELTPEDRGTARAATITTESAAVEEIARIWGDSGIVDPSDQYYVFFQSRSLSDGRSERAELFKLIEFLSLERVDAPVDTAEGEVWVRTDPRLDAEFENWS